MGNEERFNQFIYDEFMKYGKQLYNSTTDRFYNEWLNLITGRTDEVDNSPEIREIKAVIKKQKNPDIIRSMQAKINHIRYENSQKYRDMFSYSSQIHFDEAEYNDIVSLNHIISNLAEFYGTGREDTAYFPLPTLSNAPEAGYIHFVRYSGEDYKKTVVDQLVQLALGEWNRIKIVESRKNEKYKITPFDTLGNKFIGFKYLNKHLAAIKKLDKAINNKNGVFSIRETRYFFQMVFSPFEKPDISFG
jgi:hypothetical protein